MLRYLLTILIYCTPFVPVKAESASICFIALNWESTDDRDEPFDSTLRTTHLRGIVSHPLLNLPNSQSFTCTQTPVQFTIQIPYRATRIDWLLSGISGISPANDTTVFLPNPTDSFFSGSRMYYTYPLAAQYVFSEKGVKTVGMRYYHPSINNATRSETSSYEVTVVEGPEVKMNVDFEGCTNGFAQLSAEVTPWIIPVNKYVWQVDNGIAGTELNHAVIIKEAGKQLVTFSAITENGCSGSASTWIEAAPSPQISISPQANACEGKPVEINYESSLAAGHINQWIWDFGNGNHLKRTNGDPFVQEFSHPGTYQVSVHAVSDKGCKSTTAFQNVLVHMSPKLQLSLSGKACIDSTLHWVSAETGTTDRITQWHWLDASGNLTTGATPLSIPFSFSTPQTPAPIRHWATTASGCVSDTIHSPPIFIHENPIINFMVNRDTLCAGEAVLVSTNSSVSTGSNWVWQLNQKSFNQKPPFQYIAKESGLLNIQLQFKDEKGCGAKEVTQKVFIAPLPLVDAGPDLKTNKTTSIKIMAPEVADAVSYSWIPADLLSNPHELNPVATVFRDTKFTLTATNSFGCKSSDNMTIKAFENIYIPSAFSPNGDGLNDYWQISGLSEEVHSTVFIYDRFGQIIYQSSGKKHRWDGTKGGQKMPSGNYVYMLQPGDGTEMRKGTITLLR